jgi:cysteinyl-tRNA synthetase
MSKSSGEFLTLSLLESKNVNPLAYRLFCLQSHYRKPLVFSWETLANAEAAYAKLIKRIANLKTDGEADAGAVAAYREKFIEAVGNDINTAQGLTVLYDMLKDRSISDATKRAIAADLDNVLALDLLSGKKEEPKKQAAAEEIVVPEEDKWIVELIAERKAAKKAKDFARADAIRDELLAKGVTLIDTREGTKYTKN